jgi:acyl transferase domain-containing protein/acyl carrier protein
LLFAEARIETMKDHRSKIEFWLREHAAKLLGNEFDEISSETQFSRLGIDSAKAIALASGLESFLYRRISPTLLWEFPTIQSLAEHLSGMDARSGHSNYRVREAVEPVAVVGMSCRFPGATDPEAFWRLVSSGTDAVREIPAERWDVDAYYDPDPSAPGKMNARHGGFLDHVDLFEPQFFGISPREAIQMDPQQRLMLELSWEAFEDAGISPESLRDSDTAVFVGVTFHDYADLHLKARADITSHTGPGQAFDIIANRVSYAFGLQGPSMAIDTACSSSLVAVHQACMSLHNGEADVALAGGVNLILSPELMVAMSKFGGLSPDGHCRPFDAGATGFARGEGGGLVVLKPLSAAIANGDRIYCVILGSATNNDGASNGLSAPNPLAQEKLLRHVYRLSGVPTDRVHYVEAHGTGTPLGDPIEARSLGTVLGFGREPQKPLRIGSVKSNIGHLESAAGIAGLIKTVLSLHHRELPPSLHYEKPNPYIAFDELNLKVQNTLTPWPDDGAPATAGVSSFGWGGTNCHVVLREAHPDRLMLFPIAADSMDELRQRAVSLRNAIAEAEIPLASACLSSALSLNGKTRRAMPVSSKGELLSALAAASESVMAQKQFDCAAPKLAFVFSPAGGHWIGMGRELIRTEPVFRATLMECRKIVVDVAGWDLLDLLESDRLRDRFGDVAFNFPATAAIQISLAALWRSWGIEPAAVVGHSIGEIAAAHVAGILNLPDAMTVIAHYGGLVRRDVHGAIALIALPPAAVQALIDERGLDLCLAVDSGSRSSIVSGSATAVGQLLEELGRDVYASRIDLNGAPHSPRVDGFLDEYRLHLQNLKPQSSDIPMISTVTGGPIDGAACDGDYWARNLRQPIQFAKAMQHLFNSGFSLFLEIGPHPLLAREIEALGSDVTVLPSIRRAEDEQAVLLKSLGRLYELGKDVEWRRLYPVGTTTMPLPTEKVASPLLSLWERSPEGRERVPEARVSRPALFVLSAHSREGLVAMAAATATFVDVTANTSLEEFCASATLKRAHLTQRLAVVADSPAALSSDLKRLAAGDVPPGGAIGRKPTGKRPKLAFLFCGQGPQWWAMGRRLLESEPVFRSAILDCNQLAAVYGCSILADLTASEPASRLRRTDVAQPALFALQVALARLWKSWGIEPDAVVGHSVGEIAAAHVAGALDLPEAIRVICHRGRLMQRTAGLGKMAAVALGLEDSEKLLSGIAGVNVAAINAPASTVWSGEPTALKLALDIATSRRIRWRMVSEDYAFHSARMKPLAEEFAASLDGMRCRSAGIPIISTVTGRLATSTDFDAAYWARLADPVRFAAAMQYLLANGWGEFLEIGPHPVLATAAMECSEAANVAASVLPSLRRAQDDHAAMLQSLGRLYVSGHSVAWSAVNPAGTRFVRLPLTVWQRQRYWIDEPKRYVQRPQQQLPAESADDVTYKLEWRSIPRPESTRINESGRWLILADSTGVSAELARRLEATGSRCVIVSAGDVAGLVREVRKEFGNGHDGWRGVIHLWSLQDGIGVMSSLAAVERAQELGCGAALHLLQSLSDSGLHGQHQLWLVTRGSQALDGLVDPAQAPLWGFGRVVALEHPELQGGLLDLDPAASISECAAAIFDEITRPDGENQIAIRRGRRFAARLIPLKVTANGAARFRADGAYLITGGSGALGLHVARWLEQHGARHLVLLSRGSGNGSAEAAVAALRRKGCQVDVLRADVGDADQLASALGELRLRLLGVFHAAGTLSPSDLVRAHPEDVAPAFRAKVLGGWNLHNLTRTLPLDHFVCFSSIASVWGSRGMGLYAAANQFLDALAYHRSAIGLPGLAVNWGPWAGDGMGSVREVASSVRFGIDALSPEHALERLGSLLHSGNPQAVVARVRWKTFKPAFEARARRPILEAIDAGLSDVAEPPGRGRLAESLRKASPATIPVLLRNTVAAEAREVLGLPMSQPLDFEQGFFEMGMDSLMAVEFKKRLEFALGCMLPRTVAFEYPNVTELATHLAEPFLMHGTVRNNGDNGNGDKYEQLSDSQAEELLLQRLANMEGKA